MATEYDELHEHYNNFEECNSDANIKLEDCIVQTGDSLDSKARISLINDNILAQDVLLENIKVENVDEWLRKDISSSENCERYNSDRNIKLEDCIVKTEDSIDSKAGIPLISDANPAQLSKDIGSDENCEICLDSKAGVSVINDHDVAQSVLLKNANVDNLNYQNDKNSKYKHKLLEKICVCARCGKSFKGIDKLYLHFRKVHSARKDHSCKTGLTRHTKMHTGEKPFTCKVCKKSFSQKGGLISHMKTHANEKPSTCVVCKMSFCHRWELMDHIITHTSEKHLTVEFLKSHFAVPQ